MGQLTAIAVPVELVVLLAEAVTVAVAVVTAVVTDVTATGQSSFREMAITPQKEDQSAPLTLRTQGLQIRETSLDVIRTVGLKAGGRALRGRRRVAYARQVGAKLGNNVNIAYTGKQHTENTDSPEHPPA